METKKDVWVEVEFKNIPDERTSLFSHNKKNGLNFFKNRSRKRPIINGKAKSIYYVNDKKNDISCFNIFKILFCCDKN